MVINCFDNNEYYSYMDFDISMYNALRIIYKNKIGDDSSRYKWYIIDIEAIINIW